MPCEELKRLNEAYREAEEELKNFNDNVFRPTSDKDEAELHRRRKYADEAGKQLNEHPARCSTCNSNK